MVVALLQFVDGLFGLLNLLIIVWCLLTWFPNIRWYDQPWSTLDKIVSPILAPFKKLIPPIGNIDISAIVAIFALRLIQTVIQQGLVALIR
jgi:YggT family protein